MYITPKIISRMELSIIYLTNLQDHKIQFKIMSIFRK